MSKSSSAMHRRSFLAFLGKGTAGFILLPTGWAACSTKPSAVDEKLGIKPLVPSAADELMLADGLSYQVLVRWGDPIAPDIHFGFNNDFTAYRPLDPANPDEGLLWVNHEYVDPRFVSGGGSGAAAAAAKTRDQVVAEMAAVGGSILHIRRDKNAWQVVSGDPLNRRLDGSTMIPFNWPEPIAGAKQAMGTLANCSGGMLPNGNILTCEENYDQFYGERNTKTGAREPISSDMGWYRHFDNPPEHYGWVVEVNTLTGEAQKHVALGRCAHECATVQELADGRLVVYTGDDANDECLYKFIGSEPGSLREGTLYVARLDTGTWEAVVHERPELNEAFADQTEVLIRLRQAAKLLGGTPLDRPEDIDIDPLTGHVLVSLTNNKPKGNLLGSIMKLEEENGDFAALRFTTDTYLAGGKDTGFACPDNMAFDPRGNLWFTSDISGSALNKGVYASFGNNGLYLVPRSGPQAGEVIQVASAPVEAELTGPWFSPDGRTLFLSVQHPGEQSADIKQPSSHWPDGGDSMPKPAVVTIQGALLEAWSVV